jgi:hypothetical protein
MYILNIFITINVEVILLYCVNLAINCIISHIMLHDCDLKIGHIVVKLPLCLLFSNVLLWFQHL